MPIFGQIRMKTANFTPDLGSSPLRRRHHLGIPISDGRRSLPGETTGTSGEVWAGTPPRKDAPDRVRQVCRREPETQRRRETRDVRFPGLQAYTRAEQAWVVHG